MCKIHSIIQEEEKRQSHKFHYIFSVFNTKWQIYAMFVNGNHMLDGEIKIKPINGVLYGNDYV